MGLFGGTKRKYYGLDVGNGIIKLVEISHDLKNDKFILERFKAEPTPAATIKNGVISDHRQFKEILTNMRKSMSFGSLSVVTVLTGQNLIVRQVEVPKMPEDEIRKVLALQADHYFGIPADDLSSDFHILRELPEERLQLLLVGSLKAPILDFAQALKECGLRASRLDIEPLAALRSLRMPGVLAKAAAAETTVMVDLGAGTTNLSIFQGDELQMVRVLTVAGNDFTEAIVGEQGVSWAEAEALKQKHGVLADSPIYHAIEPILQRLLRQITISLEYYQVQNRDFSMRQVRLIGGNSLMEGLIKALVGAVNEVFTRLNMDPPQVGRGNPCTHLQLGAKAEGALEQGAILAVAIGLALGGGGSQCKRLIFYPILKPEEKPGSVLI